MFFLFITHATGFVQVLTFPTLFDRALHMIGLARQPLVLRVANY
jgi:hypothetical protein